MVTSSNQQSDLYAFALHHSALSASVNKWNNKQENKRVLELKWLQDMLNNVTTAIATIYFLICVQLCCNVFWKVHQNYLLNFNIAKILCGTATPTKKKTSLWGGCHKLKWWCHKYWWCHQFGDDVTMYWWWCRSVLVMMALPPGSFVTSPHWCSYCWRASQTTIYKRLGLRGHLKVNRSSLFVKPTPL